MKKPLVSVIVTTKNSSRYINACLHSIRNQSYTPIEIIVVDNNSVDNTKKIAKKYTSSVWNYGPERSSQRNFGFKKSRGTYILFLDSDMIITENVIAECVKKMNDTNIHGIYIPEKISGTSYFSKIRNFERSFYNETVIDAVRFVNRRDYKLVNGFDETLFAGEDWDFDKRIRKLGRASSIKSALNHDESENSIFSYIAKKAYYAPNLQKYRQKWHNDLEVQKQFNIFYRYAGVFTENGKWKKLIQHPHLALPMFFLRFVVGLTYLFSGSNEKK